MPWTLPVAVLLFVVLPEVHDDFWEKVDNSALRWDGCYFGLQVEIDKSLLERCHRLPEDAHLKTRLLLMLGDEKTFAVAHVLLALCVEKRALISGSADRWYGLKVDIAANGAVSYPKPKEQMKRLQNYWRRVLAQRSRKNDPEKP